MRWLEWLLLFGGVPLVLRWRVPPDLWPYLLAALALPGLLAACRRGGGNWKRRPRPAERVQLRVLLRRFGICALGLLTAVALLAPERLFDMPRQQTALWLLLLATYPLFSAYPQELIYRYLFRRRYRRLFRRRGGWIAASAAAFAWLHIVFGNWLAVVLTLIAGAFFAQTYLAGRSLRLAVVEHTLYGALVFSVGIGEFFYHERVSAGGAGLAVAAMPGEEAGSTVAAHIAGQHRWVGTGQIHHDQPVQRVGERRIDIEAEYPPAELEVLAQ